MSDVFVASIDNFQSERISFGKIHSQGTGRNGISVADFGKPFEEYSFRVFKPLGVDFGIFIENRFITVLAYPQVQYWGGRNNLVYADIAIDDRGQIVITDKDVYEIPAMADQNVTINDMTVYQDKIYVSVVQRDLYGRDVLIEIAKNGQIKEIYNPFFQETIITFFEYQGYLCAYLNTRQVVCTTDGENWQYVANISPLMYWWYEIDDYLFVPLEDKIYLFTGDIFNLELYQLPISNMKGVTISSVSKFKNDLVITTSNGIFYKSMKEISRDKKLIGLNNRGSINLQGE